MKYILLVLVLSVVVGCGGSKGMKKYSGSVYSFGHLSKYNESLIDDYSNNPYNHMKVAMNTFRKKQYGTCMYALSEALKIKNDLYIAQYNLALVFNRIGVKDAALSKLYYVYNRSKDIVLRNRSLKVYLLIKNGGEVDDEMYFKTS